MFYKIEKGNELFEQLKALFIRMVKCNSAALQACEAIAGKDAVPVINQKYLAGGLDGITCETKPNMTMWRHIGHPENQTYYPRPHMVATINLINSLPRVEWRELNAILNYFGNQLVQGKRGKMVVRGAGMKCHEDFILIHIHSKTKYTPIEHMVAIGDEEYFELEEKIRLQQ